MLSLLALFFGVGVISTATACTNCLHLKAPRLEFICEQIAEDIAIGYERPQDRRAFVRSCMIYIAQDFCDSCGKFGGEREMEVS